MLVILSAKTDEINQSVNVLFYGCSQLGDIKHKLDYRNADVFTLHLADFTELFSQQLMLVFGTSNLWNLYPYLSFSN